MSLNTLLKIMNKNKIIFYNLKLTYWLENTFNLLINQFWNTYSWFFIFLSSRLFDPEHKGLERNWYS